MAGHPVAGPLSIPMHHGAVPSALICSVSASSSSWLLRDLVPGGLERRLGVPDQALDADGDRRCEDRPLLVGGRVEDARHDGRLQCVHVQDVAQVGELPGPADVQRDAGLGEDRDVREVVALDPAAHELVEVRCRGELDVDALTLGPGADVLDERVRLLVREAVHDLDLAVAAGTTTPASAVSAVAQAAGQQQRAGRDQGHPRRVPCAHLVPLKASTSLSSSQCRSPTILHGRDVDH